MAPTFYDQAISPLLHGLRNALAILRKAEAHAAANSIDSAEYTTAQLYPDMNDFCYQIYSFTDTAKGIPSRINPSNPTLTMPDVEKTFPELIERVTKTIAFVETITPESIIGREAEHVDMSVRDGQIVLGFDTAVQYLTTFAHPNFWFHITVMYSLLRMKGVPVGKMDFLNSNHTMQFKLPDGGYTNDLSKMMSS